MSRNRCPIHEEALSALVDGELEQSELLPTVDHLAECAGCREFYRKARSLERLVLGATSRAPSVQPSAELWDRIEAATAARAARPAAPVVAWRSWGGAVAAAILLSVGLWLVLDRGASTARSAEAGYVEVVLEQDRGAMSERRFVELTTELLRADGRYHRKMRDVMELVTDRPARREGSSEDRYGLRDGDYPMLLDGPREAGGERSTLATPRPPV